MTRDATSLKKKDIDALRESGLNDEQILEAAEITGFFNYINRVIDALGVQSDLEERRAALKRLQSKTTGDGNSP